MRIPTVLILLSIFLGITVTSGAEVLIITKADSGRQVSVHVGSVIQIELEEQGATGYLWQFDDLDEEYFELIKAETEKIDRPGFTGGRLLKRWQLRTKKKGVAKVSMVYFRPWEGKEQAADTFSLSVHIN